VIAGYELPTSFRIRIRRVSFVCATASGCDETTAESEASVRQM
jgi:hypothetical protein